MTEISLDIWNFYMKKFGKIRLLKNKETFYKNFAKSYNEIMEMKLCDLNKLIRKMEEFKDEV